ncbi:MAG: XrtA/PEP-CTERM system TPR-repeat protein PrsT [Pseudomonadota bacterium]
MRLNKPLDTCCLILIALAMMLAGCGLTTSDEERMQRADESMAKGAYRAAMIELKKVLSGDEDNAEARLKLARVSLGLGDFVAAEVNVERAIEVTGNTAGTRALQFDTMIAQSKFDDLIATMALPERFLDDAKRLEYTARAQLGLSQLDAARESYAALKAKAPGSTVAILGQASVEAASGNVDIAIEQLTALVGQDPKNADALFLLGSLYQRRADYANAIDIYTQAEAAQPSQVNLPRYFDTLLALTDSHISSNQLEGARRWMTELERLIPTAPPTLYLQAKLKRVEGDYDAAARYLQEMLQLTPDNQAAQFMLGQVQLLRGNTEQAADVLGRVVSSSPNNVAARKLLAQVRLQQSRPDAALEALSPVLDASSSDVGMQKLLALVSMQQGDAADLESRLEAIRKLAPDDTGSQLGLASLKLQAGDTQGALAMLDAIEISDENVTDIVAVTLEAIAQSGDEARLVAQAREFVSQYPTQAVLRTAALAVAKQNPQSALSLVDQSALAQTDANAAQLLRADILVGDDTAAGAAAYRKLLETDPDNTQANLQLARVLVSDNEPEQALDRLNVAIAADPQATLPRLLAIQILMDQGDLSAAEQHVNEIIAQGTTTLEPTLFVAQALTTLGRLDDALAQTERAQSMQPRNPLVRYLKAQILLGLERTNEARGELVEALVLQPDWRDARLLLAVVELEDGMISSAEDNIARLKADHPEHAPVSLLEGDWFAAQRRWQEASAAYQRAAARGAGGIAALRDYQARNAGGLSGSTTPLTGWLADNPQDVGIRMALAQHQLNTNGMDAAADHYAAVLEVDANNAIALNNLAWHYHEQGRVDDALSLAMRAAQVAPQSAQIADTLGWIYRDAGRIDEALSVLRRAATMSPGDPEIQYHVAVVLADKGQADEARNMLQALLDSGATFADRENAVSLLQQL